MYKALYNFSGQDGEMDLVKGEQVEVKEKDDNGQSRVFAGAPRYAKPVGWWKIVKNGQEGWAPSN